MWLVERCGGKFTSGGQDPPPPTHTHPSSPCWTSPSPSYRINYLHNRRIINIWLNSNLLTMAWGAHTKHVTRSLSSVPEAFKFFSGDITWLHSVQSPWIMSRTSQRSRDSSVSVRAERLEFDSRKGAEIFSIPLRVQTGSETNPASLAMGAGGSILGGTATAAWSWPLMSI
jgi:hypothetical protein